MEQIREMMTANKAMTNFLLRPDKFQKVSKNMQKAPRKVAEGIGADAEGADKDAEGADKLPN